MIHAIETLLLEFITRVYEAMGWPGVVLLMAVESAAIPLPSELIMPLAGWLLIQAQGGSLWLVALAGFYGALGNLLGSLAAYWVSMKGGRPLLRRYGKYVLMTQEEVDRAERWFQKYGEWAVFFSRLLPVVRTFISVPAGIARMNLRKFVIYTFVGSFPWSLGLAYGGYLLGSRWETLRAAMRPFDIPIVIILAAAVIWFVVRRLRALRAERRQDDARAEASGPGDGKD
ncbi:MAG: DedA family protein [SAR202 cluster bacterium]|nr:DedA family protein [SAR202 cluster bacterium]